MFKIQGKTFVTDQQSYNQTGKGIGFTGSCGCFKHSRFCQINFFNFESALFYFCIRCHE